MGTNPFHTFDPWDTDRAEAMMAVLEAGDEALAELLDHDPSLGLRLEIGAAPLTSRDELPWDDCTLVWLAAAPPGPDGTLAPWTLESSRIRERLGRYPWGDGSAITYVRDHLRPPAEGGWRSIQTLFEALAMRLAGPRGEGRFSSGAAGLRLLGYLTPAEVESLRQDLQQVPWRIAADEPLDGGVRDTVSHLVSVLRAAERHKVGLLHRRHM